MGSGCMARIRKKLGKGRHYDALRKENASLPDAYLARLVNQKYAVVGEHSAAKLCHWAGESLRGAGECYKSKFYGIASHRCLQCTPVLQFCNHACVFCWRMMPERDKYGDVKGFEWGDAKEIADAPQDLKKLDKNNDGKLTAEEFLPPRPVNAVEGDKKAGEAKDMKRPASPLITALDVNGDGVIDEKEIAGSSEALKKLDKNGDGKITRDEAHPARPEGEKKHEGAKKAELDAPAGK